MKNSFSGSVISHLFILLSAYVQVYNKTVGRHISYLYFLADQPLVIILS